MGVSDRLLRLSLLSFALTAPLSMRVQRQIKLIFQPIRHRALPNGELLKGRLLAAPIVTTQSRLPHVQRSRFDLDQRHALREAMAM
jgi:hypothetical protein